MKSLWRCCASWRGSRTPARPQRSSAGGAQGDRDLAAETVTAASGGERARRHAGSEVCSTPHAIRDGNGLRAPRAKTADVVIGAPSNSARSSSR